MMNIPAFPKIFHLGDRSVARLFDDDVEITEKVDGSQFAFGWLDDRLQCRSKGAIINPDIPPNLFAPAVAYVQSIKDRLPKDIVFWGETLCKPKHNSLGYERVPTNHIALFGYKDFQGMTDPNYERLKAWAGQLGLDVVPLLYDGKIESHTQLNEFLDRDSFLGKVKLEGIVVKRWVPTEIYGAEQPCMAMKLVSDRFKEIHSKNPDFMKGKSKWIDFCEAFRTEARWEKAIIHLKEEGLLEDSPRDIGKIIPEVNRDITEECKELIKEKLWQFFGKEVFREATKGFPEWYKNRLVSNAFDSVEETL